MKLTPPRGPAIHGTTAIERPYWGKLLAIQEVLCAKHGAKFSRRDVVEGLIDYYLEHEPEIAAAVEPIAPELGAGYGKNRA